MRNIAVVLLTALALAGCETLGLSEASEEPAARTIRPAAPEVPPPLPVPKPPGSARPQISDMPQIESPPQGSQGVTDPERSSDKGQLLIAPEVPDVDPLDAQGPAADTPDTSPPEAAAPEPELPESELPPAPSASDTEDPADSQPAADPVTYGPCRLSGEIVMATTADCAQMGGVPLQ